MSFRDLKAPDLVKEWRKIVNDNIRMGRDAHLIKDFLGRATPVQVMCGLYLYKDVRTVTIPQFLSQWESWLIEDEAWAEVELARQITRTTPENWYIYNDSMDEETATAFHRAFEARRELIDWADKVLS